MLFELKKKKKKKKKNSFRGSKVNVVEAFVVSLISLLNFMVAQTLKSQTIL